MFKTSTAAVVGALLTAGCAASAADSKYELKRVVGPRNDIYVRVPTEQPRTAEGPYALTGREERQPTERQERQPAERRVEQRWVGPRYIGPAYVYERGND